MVVLFLIFSNYFIHNVKQNLPSFFINVKASIPPKLLGSTTIFGCDNIGSCAIDTDREDKNTIVDKNIYFIIIPLILTTNSH
jgi:hypothetical protein